MHPPRFLLRLLTIGIGGAMFGYAVVGSVAQEVGEYQVKAAYIYNFAKFVAWPTQTVPDSSRPLRICTFQNAQFQELLIATIKGKGIGSHPLLITNVGDSDRARLCHLLFISSAHQSQAAAIVEDLKDSSVLTVGDMDRFLEQGGMINLIVRDSHVQFEVNERAAVREGLHINACMLSVAKRVVK
jgi:uncharacterized protein DUF4154